MQHSRGLQEGSRGSSRCMAVAWLLHGITPAHSCRCLCTLHLLMLKPCAKPCFLLLNTYPGTCFWPCTLPCFPLLLIATGCEPVGVECGLRPPPTLMPSPTHPAHIFMSPAPYPASLLLIAAGCEPVSVECGIPHHHHPCHRLRTPAPPSETCALPYLAASHGDRV